jgi:hypothetical protein
MKVLELVELYYSFTKALENTSNSGTRNMCDSEAICNFSSKVARSYLPEAYMHAQGGVKHPSSKPTMSLPGPGTNDQQCYPLVDFESQIQLDVL